MGGAEIGAVEDLYPHGQKYYPAQLIEQWTPEGERRAQRALKRASSYLDALRNEARRAAEYLKNHPERRWNMQSQAVVSGYSRVRDSIHFEQALKVIECQAVTVVPIYPHFIGVLYLDSDGNLYLGNTPAPHLLVDKSGFVLWGAHRLSQQMLTDLVRQRYFTWWHKRHVIMALRRIGH